MFGEGKIVIVFFFMLIVLRYNLEADVTPIISAFLLLNVVLVLVNVDVVINRLR